MLLTTTLILANLCSAGCGFQDEEAVQRLHSVARLLSPVPMESGLWRRFASHVPLPGGLSEAVGPVLIEGMNRIDLDTVAGLIREAIEPRGWKEQGWSIACFRTQLLVDAPPRIHAAIDSLLDELEWLFVRSTVPIAVRVVGFEEAPSPAPGFYPAGELAALREELDRRGTLLWSSELKAHPGLRRSAGRRISKLVLEDYDIEVAQDILQADPVIVAMETGFLLSVIPWPLDDGERVALEIEFDHSDPGELARFDTGWKVLGKLDQPRIGFAALRQHAVLPWGGGLFTLVRGGPLGHVGILVELEDPPRSEKPVAAGLPVLHTGFLFRERAFPWQLSHPYDLAGAGDFHGEAEEVEPRPVLAPGELDELAFRSSGKQGRALVPIGPLTFDLGASEAETVQLHKVVREIEAQVAPTAHFELLVVRGESRERPEGEIRDRIVSSATLFATSGESSVLAVGNELTLLADYDVEVSNQVGGSDPIVDKQFCGNWLHVRPLAVERDRALLDVSFHARELLALERVELDSERIGDLQSPTLDKVDHDARVELRVGEREWLGAIPGEGPDGASLHAFLELVAVDSFDSARVPGGAEEPSPGIEERGEKKEDSPSTAPGRYAGRFEDKDALRARYGASSTERPLAAALAWLAQHQDEEGCWRSALFTAHCPSGDLCTGPGGALYDVGDTSLALLAFLGDGHHPARETPYRSVATRACAWLVEQQAEGGEDDGLIGGRAGFAFNYGHGIASLALCEAYALSGLETLRAPAQRAVDFILRARNPGKAWRYAVPPDGENDTSITGWMVLALVAAREAGLEVDEEAFKGALAWFDEVIDPATGRVGYTQPGEPPARALGKQDRYPNSFSESLTALALESRLLMGESPMRNPRLGLHADLLLSALPAWAENGSSNDLYYWHHGSLAMFQMGGDYWRRWNEALKKALLPHQRRFGHAKGSWDPVGPWGEDGGRVYSTALCALCLESCFRYSRVARER